MEHNTLLQDQHYGSEQKRSNRTFEVLSAERVSKAYGGVRVLDGVSLQIHRAESIAIMGPSGSGKTTFMHCLSGIVLPDSGSVRFYQGEVTTAIHELNEKQRSQLRLEEFAFVFQKGFLFPELTVQENVAIVPMLKGLRRREAEMRAQEVLDHFSIGEKSSSRIGELSGGQIQRVAIARAYIANAPIVFADEPTGALDSRSSEKVLDCLFEATVFMGKSLCLVTHDERVAQRCDRIFVMENGKFFEKGV